VRGFPQLWLQLKKQSAPLPRQSDALLLWDDGMSHEFAYSSKNSHSFRLKPATNSN
jgi:hypothetical protein